MSTYVENIVNDTEQKNLWMRKIQIILSSKEPNINGKYYQLIIGDSDVSIENDLGPMIAGNYNPSGNNFNVKISGSKYLATLKDKKFIEDSIIKGKESRDLLYEGVSKINKLHVLKSQSNFMVIDVRETGFTANELSYELLKKGVIVRDCTSFKGLDEYWIRISIATIEEDKKFLNILKEVVN